MNHDQHDETSKRQSPHPALQSVLQGLRELNTDRDNSPPVFDNKSKARLFIDIQQDDDSPSTMRLTPVWDIDHADLDESEVVGWTMTKYPS